MMTTKVRKLTEVQERVQRGVRLLDRRVPDWRDSVSAEGLDIQDPCCCILGQLYGSYFEGLDHLAIGDRDRPQDYGFTSEDDFTPWRDFARLQEAWEEELA